MAVDYGIMNDQREWLGKLRAIVEQYEREVAEAERAVQAAQDRLRTAQKSLGTAESFLVMETEKVAGESPAQVPLGKAAAAIVREKGTATISDIIQALEARGFNLETSFKGRAIHAALLHASDIKKVAPGTYEAEQPSLL